MRIALKIMCLIVNMVACCAALFLSGCLFFSPAMVGEKSRGPPCTTLRRFLIAGLEPKSPAGRARLRAQGVGRTSGLKGDVRVDELFELVEETRIAHVTWVQRIAPSRIFNGHAELPPNPFRRLIWPMLLKCRPTGSNTRRPSMRAYSAATQAVASVEGMNS